MILPKKAALLAVSAVLLFSGCLPPASSRRTISLSGSASMEQVLRALGEDFTARTGISVEAQFGGSSQGIRDAAEGKADIGCTSRALTAQEQEILEAIPVASDYIIPIVHPDNPVPSLTLRQLSGLYTGEIRNWAEVGGTDSPVVAIGRDAASGTRAAFEELLGVSGQCLYAQEKDSAGGIRIAVETTPGAIGYVSLEAAEEGGKIKRLPLNGEDGEVTLSRLFFMAVPRGKALRDDVREFLDYVHSEEGQAVVRSQKLGAVE